MSLDIKYSVRYVIYDVNYCESAAKLRYTEWPKKVSHYQMIKNRIKSY